MKSLIIVIFSILLMTNISAGEFTGAGKQINEVLKAHNMSAKQLKAQGMKIVRGEVTGAGLTVNLQDVFAIVTKTDLIKMSEVDHIEFVHPSEAKAMKDVKRLDSATKKVNKKDILAVIVD
ncbi:MAG: hypothetical protein GY909_19065 [Oligoflexia bacterium]|nr:hypothetical protein [Oligoflexia bacterium]